MFMTGCIDYEPDVGKRFPGGNDGGVDAVEGAPVGCDNRDSDPLTVVSFSANIRPLMNRTPGGCAPCHLGRATSGGDWSSYQSLRRGGTNSGARIVVTGEPCSSIFFQKLGRTPPFGSRMPLNGPPYFSAEERQLVHDWIAEGAQNN
jgi:hypothetical protein